MAFKDKMQVGEQVSAGVSGPTPKPEDKFRKFEVESPKGVIKVEVSESVLVAFKEVHGIELEVWLRGVV